MKRKSLRVRRAATSAKPAPGTVSEVPLDIESQNEDVVAVLTTSIKSNHDLPDVREDVSKGNINNDINKHSNGSSHDSLDDDDTCQDFLDRKNCVSCDEGGEVLVCAETSCPVNLHAECLSIEPKFDDKGNFYCPYCWYKRARAEALESKKKAFLAKKDLSKFFCQNGITIDKLAENDVGVKTKELKEVSVLGNGSGLDYHNRPGNESVHGQPLKTVQDEQNEGERVMANADQNGIAVEDEAHAKGPVANTGDSKHYGEEKTPVGIELVHKSSNREKFDILNNSISRTHETRFVEGQEGIELEGLRYNNEHVHAMIVKDAKPLSAFHFGEYKDGHSPDDAFAKEIQEGVEAYIDLGRVKDREKLFQNELNLSATDCSVSETGVSDAEPLPMKESHVEHQGQTTAYTQRVPSVRKSSPLNRKIEGKNACHIKEDAISETSVPPRRSSLRGCSKEMTSQTGKRKRVNWTVEEETMLKEGVLRFSMGQRTIPWKKILEFGCNVFDSKRTTADLKDKWKNMRV